jgi:hypothetical protein
MTESPELPEVPAGLSDTDAAKALYDAELDDWKSRARDPVTEETREHTRDDAREDTANTVLVARQDAAAAAEAALLASIQSAYIEVAKTSLDRAITRASNMTGLITAVSTAYTALLALVYGGEKEMPLPGRALIPMCFLGFALVLAAFYVAFLRRKMKQRNLLPTGIDGTLADERLKTFLDWVFAGVLERAWALRTSIITFGLGVALLPLPFADVSSETTRNLTILAGVAVVAWLGGELAYRQTKSKGEGYVPDLPSIAADSQRTGESG